ncbi:DUF4190 domain-containing protein [Curtobacterium flaccumfaciens]|uniref:DUF4190 domain-containing protein n=1 Tax=Curtobacterium flaccumfaciens TaxID=2035 RepID=UPI001BDEF385|nr:DUF4190 domain-containing protein [Curtobacterium flaccumfaciens]MBT1681908.1 DUF4190 domain-containing protein [Curtobacterium flaccumfaciens pv. flaccumfaciens]
MTNNNPDHGVQSAPPTAPYTYPQQVVVGYQPSPPKGLSVTSMVLGLVSIVLGFTFLVPLVGFVLGIIGIRREPAGRGMAITGLVLNGLFVIGWALVIVLVFVVGIGAATSTYQQ